MLDVRLIETLIERISYGDNEAFETLYNMYAKKVYNTAKMITENEKAAEDILQEVFLTIYTKIYKLKHVEAFESWLYRIVINCCNEYFRKNKKLVVTDDGNLDDIAGVSNCEIPGEALIKKENYKDLRRCVSILPEKMKECVVLYYYSEMSIIQISEVLGCSVGTVKSNMFKAKKALKKSLNLNIDCEVNTYGYR